MIGGAQLLRHHGQKPLSRRCDGEFYGFGLCGRQITKRATRTYSSYGRSSTDPRGAKSVDGAH